MPFDLDRLSLSGLVFIKAKAYADGRGFFSELYRASLFREAGISFECRQINHSRSTRGVLRGLHYQLAPQAQAKLVYAAEGEIFDVAVDIRRDSPTFGRSLGARLSAEEHSMLLIPEGFAHGFCVLSPTADVVYCCSKEYSPQHERGILWNDPSLVIDWPITDPVISPRDLLWPELKNADIKS